MKKSLIAAALMVATSAFAQEYVKLDFAPNVTNYQDRGSAYQAGITLGKNFDKQWFAEGKYAFAKAKEDGKDVTNSVAGGIGMNVTEWGFVRAGLSHTFNSAADSYNSYSYGGGVNLPLAPGLKAFGSVDRTLAFNNEKPAFTTYEAGVGFDFDKNNGVGVSYINNRGDVDTHGLKFGYTHKF
jgi:hypothetical protein